MNVKQRLLTYIAHTGQSVSEFERSCGLANAYVRNIRQTITPEKAQRIIGAYPLLNCDWLLTGRGSMEFRKVPLTSFDTTILYDEYARLLECALYLQTKPNRQDLLNLQLAILETISKMKENNYPYNSIDLLYRRSMRLQNWVEK